MASKKPLKMDFQWNYSTQGLIRRKGFNAELQNFFAKTLLEYAEPYTPKKSGKLRESSKVSGNEMSAKIQYNVPYANYQYLTPDDAWRRTTPGTSGPEHGLESSRWLDYAWMIHKQQITGKVGAYKRWHSK